MIWRIKYLSRIRQIASIIIKYGFKDLIIHFGLKDIFSFTPSSSNTSSIALINNLSLQENRERMELEAAGQEHTDTAPKRLKAALQELGPVFIKLGQLLSTRPDLIPIDYIEELRNLQDNNAKVPFETIEATIEQELGKKIDELFLSFEQEPLASASIGQVHAAVLPDGREVVIKVQRPNILALVQNDLELLTELSQLMTKRSKQSRRYDLPNIVDMLSRTLINELDYRTEARNTHALKRNLLEFPHITVPDVVDEYSTKYVLTTSRLYGTNVMEDGESNYRKEERKLLAVELAQSYLKQICVDGFFHSDPHPGNIMLIDRKRLRRGRRKKEILNVKVDGGYQVGALEGKAELGLSLKENKQLHPRVALIDCGMVNNLTRSFQEKLIEFLFFLSENHGERVAQAAIEMGTPLPEFDEKAFRTWVTDLVSQYSHTTLETMDLGQLIFNIIQIATHSGLQVPSELTMIAKTLFNLDITLIRLCPNFNLSQAVRDYAVEIATKRFKQELSFANFYSQAVQVQHLVTDLPKKIDKLIDQLNDEEFELRLHIDRSTDILKAIQKVANRITMGMITAAIIIGSAIIMHIKTNYQLFGYPSIAIIGFLVASGFGVYLIASMILKDE
jgi:ubiquinone biosynthesis protein